MEHQILMTFVDDGEDSTLRLCLHRDDSLADLFRLLGELRVPPDITGMVTVRSRSLELELSWPDLALDICPACGGVGSWTVDDDDTYVCDVCGGRKRVPSHDASEEPFDNPLPACEGCGGTGVSQVSGSICSRCSGTGLDPTADLNDPRM